MKIDPVLGHGYYWYGTIHDTSETEADVDYYSFELNVSREIKINLYNVPSGCDYDIKLYKVSGALWWKKYTEIGSSSRASNSDETIYLSTPQDQGEYVIKVKSYRGMSSSKYKLYCSFPMTDNGVAYNNRILKWTFNDPQSKNHESLVFTYVTKAIFVPYDIVKEIYEFGTSTDYMSVSNSKFGFTQEKDLINLLAENQELNLVFSIGLGAATIPLSPVGGFLVGAAGSIYSYLFGHISEDILAMDRERYNQAFYDAYHSKVGFYIEYYTCVSSTAVSNGCNYGSLKSNYYAYRRLDRNYVCDDVEQFGDFSVVFDNNR